MQGNRVAGGSETLPYRRKRMCYHTRNTGTSESPHPSIAGTPGTPQSVKIENGVPAVALGGSRK